jgi:DNA-binding transcriptional ArsR family regulator
MTRFGVMKHLRALEDAGLVVARRSGREKLHFLNPVPIRLVYDRWIDKYAERRVSALSDSRPNWRRLAEFDLRPGTPEVLRARGGGPSGRASTSRR